ncbi:uncharacterized protein LOC114263174 [Camellia sinensis]|uniref:uncharacterized protein LOC114263174 n=1 Tax=Camellia sinensis TaxID=4442 RepID=UPI001035A59A|nr:uncharacterized protein LOC114263174 [Camellia sinensis]
MVEDEVQQLPRQQGSSNGGEAHTKDHDHDVIVEAVQSQQDMQREILAALQTLTAAIMAMASRPARAPIQVPLVVPQANGTVIDLAIQEQTGLFQPTHFVTLANTVPKFIKFDGKQGNAREHVARFIETLGVHDSDHSLRLREFSKSLIERACSWYVNLAPNLIKSWEEMVNNFHTKFFQVQEKVTTFTLGRDVQKEGEDILDYVKWFQDKAIDCHEPVDEAHLVSICVEGAIRNYKIFLVNHNLPTFSALIEATRNLSTTGPLHESRNSHRYSRSSRVFAITST